MLFYQLHKVHFPNHNIYRLKWTYSRVSSCGTHHVYLNTQAPMYNYRFKNVLPFHPPGLAPVLNNDGLAYHIKNSGEQAYSQRFDRAFGFYENLAAVQVCSILHQNRLQVLKLILES